MRRYKAILFDFDGTLMNTNEIIFASWQHTYKTLTGKEGDRREIVKTFGEPLFTSMENAFPNVPVEESVAIYRDYQRDCYLDKIELFEGCKELIIELHKRGFRLAVVTSRVKSSLISGLEKYGLLDYFEAFVTCDDTDAHKPSPEPILKALEKLDIDAKDALMIGDSIFDVLCAKNAGVESVLVGWALEGAGTIIDEDVEPEFRIKIAKDLIAIVEE